MVLQTLQEYLPLFLLSLTRKQCSYLFSLFLTAVSSHWWYFYGSPSCQCLSSADFLGSLIISSCFVVIPFSSSSLHTVEHILCATFFLNTFISCCKECNYISKVNVTYTQGHASVRRQLKITEDIKSPSTHLTVYNCHKFVKIELVPTP